MGAMSVSSHLSPEPERRLWIILENMRQAVESTELKLGGLMLLAAAELAFLGPWWGARACLGLCLPLGVLGLSPLSRAVEWVPWIEPAAAKPALADSLLVPEDLLKYTLSELILKLDKYLGGGITATPYYEDLVTQILLRARAAARKQRVFRVVCALAGAGQLALLGKFFL
jgi:hypothetical protein